jgi:phosphoribosylformylglycinamidine cyclo-ligase
MPKKFSYKQAGVNIDVADATKRAMAKSLAPVDRRVLNRIGAFAALFEARFPGIRRPVLVLKMEEPGSKQKIALAHGRIRSIACDLVNHLVNDIIVMGAAPLAVQDVIVCGKIESRVVAGLVSAMAEACRAQGCSLTGGETSEQPGVLEAGAYVLAASIVGVVDKSRIIDGSRIEKGDAVLAVASNGLHTNGYSLVRRLMAEKPAILRRKVDGGSFLDAILRPHTCYWQALKGLFRARHAVPLHGMAHITGGGIQDNLNRILPAKLNAAVDLGAIRVLPVFKVIREVGSVPDADMARTFNLGVGMTLVVKPSAVAKIRRRLKRHGHDSYVIGEIVKGRKRVAFTGRLQW